MQQRAYHITQMQRVDVGRKTGKRCDKGVRCRRGTECELSKYMVRLYIHARSMLLQREHARIKVEGSLKIN